jgi:hypothetical protein
MTIDELIRILENRLSNNARLREQAVARGDAAGVVALDADTATTESTLNDLRTLVS